MNVAAGPELAAAVTNAGGLGVIGGVGYTPKVKRWSVPPENSADPAQFLRMQIKSLKDALVDKKGAFGVDLLLPKVGEGARKTNHDYTEGKVSRARFQPIGRRDSPCALASFPNSSTLSSSLVRWRGGAMFFACSSAWPAGASLFVSAVGVPPTWAVDKLHEAGIACMNMVGAPKHVKYALDSVRRRRRGRRKIAG